jgi:uncharacterized protein involved in exopolysaccharide biosynthesis
MQRVLEIVFSRWIQLIALLVVPLIIALGIVLTQPRQYEASATIWALRRYEVVGATGAESDLNASAAETQATAITEILQTKTFALAIARQANLASTYSASARSNQDQLDSAMFDDLSTHVTATPVGAYIVSITYDNKRPDIAKAVVKAVIDEYGTSAAAFATSESKQLLLIYQEQLQQAQDASKKATAAAATYLRENPGADTNKDPQYEALATAATNAVGNVTQIQGQIDTINNTIQTIGVGSNTLFKVVDQPAAGVNPISRSKTLIEGVAIGAVVGLLACIIFIVIMMRRDRSIYSVADLQKITEAPVLLQIPHMPSRILAQTVDGVESGERFLLSRDAPQGR